MAMYRENLPQMSNKLCITDGGMETTLVFHQQIDLPEFASYDLLRNEEGYDTLFTYYKNYAQMAAEHNVGLILETPTWRANPDWGEKIGDSTETLSALNKTAVKLVKHIRDDYATPDSPIVISGCIGPRGDGYVASSKMTTEEAEHYHSEQIAIFSDSDADMVAALTLNYVEEAIGITCAAQRYNIPVCISFTLETDGRLPTGETLEDAIAAVDEATQSGPAYYMINCAHPTHFSHLIEQGGEWLHRLKGIRGNASCLSHAELDEAEVLDEGNPEEFGEQCQHLLRQANSLTVIGGCCGTDTRHIEQVCRHVT